MALAILLALSFAIALPLKDQMEKSRDIEAVDGLVYTFIIGKVEGNDDLLASILTKNAQGILESGRHAFPGSAELMGEQYTIVRYENQYENGTLMYRVEFLRPYTLKTDYYNVVVINEDTGWKIAKNSSADEYIMVQLINQEKGIMVHEWER